MTTYWNLTEKGIRREASAPFTDTIEMAGHKMAAVITYGMAEDGTPVIQRELCFPELRTLPRDTFGHLRTYHNDERRVYTVNGAEATEQTDSIAFDGTVCIRSHSGALTVTRWLFPSLTLAAYIEHTVLENAGDCPITVTAPAVEIRIPVRGAAGCYLDEVYAPALSVTLAPGETAVDDVIFSARLHLDTPIHPEGKSELNVRLDFVADICDRELMLECPDEELSAFFRLAKLRAAESIFDTVGGPVHCPGGGVYYAAIWANDQAEYAGPFFPFLGYDRANDASARAYDWMAKFMGPDGKAFPSSIIDGGQDYWDGAGDRGDAAMYLYGCARYLLAMGDRPLAQRLFWTLEWTAEYCLARRNEAGVITSDADELENRLPAGDANLCTSSLTYGGLNSAADLADELGYREKAAVWRVEAAKLRDAIEAHFGATVSGYETYRYYEGNTVLRSWICIPLTVGIYDRKSGTADALLSPLLFRDDGVLSVEGDTTFWDRSTLYTFRGLLNAGEADRTYPYLQRYVTQRLTGSHVPYAVEAYPEGNQRHLSAESALFCRVVTEGLCGITPVGLETFALSPALPAALSDLTLRRVHLGGECFDLTLVREENGHHATVEYTDGRKKSTFIPLGETVVF